MLSEFAHDGHSFKIAVRACSFFIISGLLPRATPKRAYPSRPLPALAFCLLGKVFSPQYALWILPFFALVRVRWGWWAAYVVVDVVLYFGLFRWFYDLFYRNVDFGLAKQALIVGIWGRAALVALLFIVFLGAKSALLPARSEVSPR